MSIFTYLQTIKNYVYYCYNKSQTESYPSESHCTRFVGLTFGYGVFARENNSHNTIPKDHTSDCVENILSVIHSIASHFIGSGLWNKRKFINTEYAFKDKHTT